MEKSSPKNSALIASGTVGAILVIAILFLWPPSFASIEKQTTVLFFVLVGAIGLLMIVVYQWFTFQEGAKSLARTMTEDMLASSHELFYELYRSSPVAYVLVDVSGTIESTNLATVRLFNVEIGALDGLSLFDFIVESDEHNMALLPEYIKQGKPLQDSPISVQRPDGVVAWVRLSFFSFNDEQNVRKGMVTLIDITKQRMIDKAKTEFVSLASHQLRTPISAMKWNIELLQTAGKETFNELQKGYVGKIAHGLERMDALVGDFLSASKLELGTLTAQRASLDFLPFLKSIYEEYQVIAEQKNVRMEVDWDGAEGTIISDAHLLHMIVSNIWGNAVKYTLKDGVVRVHAEMSGGQVTVRITDTGIGIPDEDQGMIFSKLFRAGNARTQVTDGTGLGLYIVKEAVEILGGRINFESKMGAGTTFTVVLPQ